MKKKLQKGDRLIVKNNDYNPLTDFFLEDIDGDNCIVSLSFGILSGIATYPKNFVSKHPIQKSQFTFCVEISGNECNSNNPRINEYDKYLVDMNNDLLIYRAGFFCLNEIIKSFTDGQSKKHASEELIYILNSHDPIVSLNNFIVTVIASLPYDFESKSILEYSGEFVPVVAVYNSDRKNNNIVTAIFLILFATIMNQIGVLSKDSIIQQLKNN